MSCYNSSFAYSIYSLVVKWREMYVRGAVWESSIFNIKKFIYLPTHRHVQDVTQGQFFLAEFNWFEFRVFLLRDWLSNLKNPVCLTIYPLLGTGENNWIYTFPKGISAMWNAISLVRDLNSSRRVHFLQR